MTRVPKLIRQQVKERAAARCEYCRLPEQFAAYSHQVDHIIPPQHGGDDQLENLCLACFYCNNTKGTNIASYDPQTKLLTPLFNPRKELWQIHFALQDAQIVAKTPVGRVTILILQMNIPKQVDARQSLIEAGLW